MSTFDVLHQPWTCRDFDAEACEQAIAEYVAESNAVYFAVKFLPQTTPTSQALFAAGHSSGDIRVFSCKSFSESWVTSRKPCSCLIAWQAHGSAVYSLAVITEGGNSLLVSAGEDGWVRCWLVADIEDAASAAAGPGSSSGNLRPKQSPRQLQLLPSAELQLQNAPPSLAIASSRLPSAQTLAYHHQQNQLLVGSSDGSCHQIDVLRWLSCSNRGAGTSIPVSQVLSGHLAGVLDLDICSSTQQLASASEDGSARLWDLRGGKCTSAINIWDGELMPLHAPAAQLRCLKNAYVSCVAFDPSGSWLMAGTGNAALTLWSNSLNQIAKQQSTEKCVPQALLMQPGELLMVGSEPALHRYPFSLDCPKRISLSNSRCAFGLDVEQETGIVVAAGSHGGLELLSMYGNKLGCAQLGVPAGARCRLKELVVGE